jgi:hypothetical protein
MQPIGSITGADTEGKARVVDLSRDSDVPGGPG